MVAKSWISLLALGVVIAVPAQAVPLLDAAYDPGDTRTTIAGIGAADFAQTFTVQTSGTLSALKLLLENTSGNRDDLFVDIRRTTSGVPVESDSKPLFSRTLNLAGTSPTSQRSWLRIDVSGFGVRVSAGEVLAVALRSTPDGQPNFWWYGTSWSPSNPF